MTLLTLRSAPEFATGSQVLAVADVEIDAISEQVATLPGSLSFRGIRAEGWTELAKPGKLVSIEARDGVHEFWISQRRDDLRNNRVAFQADPVHVALRDVGVLDWLSSDGGSHINLGGPDGGMSFRNFWFTFLRPFLRRRGLDWLELGDVESDGRLIHSWEGVSAQAVAVALVEQLRHEWRLRRDTGGGVYRLDVGRELGADVDVARASEGLNLLTLRRVLDREDMATVIRPIGTLASGAPADVSLALWRVSARAGNVITLASHASVGGDGPVAVNGQWVGLYLEDTGGDAHAITGSSRAAQSVTVSSGGSDFAVGDDVRFVASAAGAGVVEVSDPGAVEEFGTIAVGQGLPFFSRADVEGAGIIEWAEPPQIIEVATGTELSGNRLNVTVDDAADRDVLFAAEAPDVLYVLVAGGNGYLYVIETGDDESSGTDLTRLLTLAENPISFAANRDTAWLFRHPLPDGWSFEDDTDFPVTFGRTPESLPVATSDDLTLGYSASTTTVTAPGFPVGTRVEPGDMIMNWKTGSDRWYLVLGSATADGTGTIVALAVFVSLGSLSPGSITGIRIYRPDMSGAAVDRVPVFWLMGSPPGMDLPEASLAPRDGASLYGSVLFSVVTVGANSAGWSTLPRLTVLRDDVEVGFVEATNWTPTAGGETTRERLTVGPLDIDDAGAYRLRFYAGNANQSYNFGFSILSAALYVGTAAPSESDLVPEAAVGIQLANRELLKRARWRARYTCSLLELADELHVSPAVIRAQVGGRVHLDSPALGIRGRFRLVSVEWSTETSRVEVMLESVGDPLTTQRAAAQPLFVQETGQRVGNAPPGAIGYYRAVEVSAAGLVADTPIDVERISESS